MHYTIAPVVFFAAFTATAGAAAHLYLHGTDGQITGKVATALGADGQPISGTGNVDNGADDVGLELGDMVYGVSFDGVSFDSATSFAAGLIDLPGMAEMASDPNSPFGELRPAGRRKGSRDRGFGTTRGPGGGDEGPPKKKPKIEETPEQKRERERKQKEEGERQADAAAKKICEAYELYKKTPPPRKTVKLDKVNDTITRELFPLFQTPLTAPSPRCEQGNTMATVDGEVNGRPSFFVGTNGACLNGRQARAIGAARKECGIPIVATPRLAGEATCLGDDADNPHAPFPDDPDAPKGRAGNKHHAEMRAIYAFCKEAAKSPGERGKTVGSLINRITCDKPACGKCAATMTGWQFDPTKYNALKKLKNPPGGNPNYHEPEELPSTLGEMTIEQCATLAADDEADGEADGKLDDDDVLGYDEDDGGGKPPAK